MGGNIERRKSELLGKEFDTNNSGKCFIIDYKGERQVTVMFYEPIFVVNCAYSHLVRGEVSNPFYPSVCGVGYLGVGKYRPKKDSQAYLHWKGVLSRVYDATSLVKNPTYKGTTVDTEWLNFQNFAEWCYKQKGFDSKDGKGRKYQLDKDILIKGNKVYSPETCCFVPQEINLLFCKSDAIRGKVPIGVTYDKSRNKYAARVTCNNTYIHLGRHNTLEQAFAVYKKAKEENIKVLASKWQTCVDVRVFEALVNYQVDITD